MDRLARRLGQLEREVRRLRQPQLAYSAVEGGPLEFNDPAGNLAIVLGPQADGSNAQVVVSGPIPPVPAGVTYEESLDGVAVRWDGTWAGDVLVAPLDFARVEVHASDEPDFVPDVVGVPSGSLVASFSSPRGGGVMVSLPFGSPHYFKLIARSTSGQYGDPTEEEGPFENAIIPGSRLAADAIDGFVITGSTLRTAAVGKRVIIDDGYEGSIGCVKFSSGGVDEELPARLEGTEFVNALGEDLVAMKMRSGTTDAFPTAGEFYLYPGGAEVSGQFRAEEQPSLIVERVTNQSIADSTWEDVSWNLGDNALTRGFPGSGWPRTSLGLTWGRRFLVTARIVFVNDTSGQRQARIQEELFDDITGPYWSTCDIDTRRAVDGTLESSLLVSAVIDTSVNDGREIRVQVRQNSGGALAIQGSSASAHYYTRMTIVQLA